MPITNFNLIGIAKNLKFFETRAPRGFQNSPRGERALRRSPFSLRPCAFGLLLLSFDTIKTYLLILIEIYDYGVGIRND